MNIQLSDKATPIEISAAKELERADITCVYIYAPGDVYLPYKKHMGDKIVADPTATNGKAVEIRADNRREKEPNGKDHLNLMKNGFKLYVSDGFNQDMDVGSLPADQLIADGEYHLYKFSDVVVVSDNMPKFLTLFRDWSFQLVDLPVELAHCPNTPVDVYVSMKIVGDLSFCDVERLPAYYIDRVIVIGPPKDTVSVTFEEVDENASDTGKAFLDEANALKLTQMKVVLPLEATEVEKNAAKELVDYVHKMTGKTMITVAEGGEVEAGIYLGDTAFAKENNVTHPSTEYGEGWAIKAVDGNLVLCGDTVRGTLYAVYHLLEDVLGIHWLTYTDEYVPVAEEALVPNDIDRKGAPAFKYRDMHPGALCHTENMFQVRNRLNGWEAKAPVGFGGRELFGAPAYVHSFAHYLPDSQFKEHSEWFSLMGGKRVPTSQLCMTNKDLLPYMKESILRYIEEDIAEADKKGTARPRWYSLCPNDWEKFCECESCKAAIKKGGMSGYLLQFVNEIASVVADKHPDILVDTLAYWVYRDVPLDDTKPAKNVQIRFAYNNMDVLHSFAHPNNKPALSQLKKWVSITPEGQTFVWDYVVTYDINGVTPTMYKYPEHLKTMLDNGVTGYFGEQEDPINTDFWELKLWLNAKLLEDPYQDFDMLMGAFLNSYYGAAGPYVHKYLDMVGGLLQKSYVRSFYWEPTMNLRWLTLEAILVAYKYFEKAFAAVNGDKTILQRLRMARNCLDRVVVTRFDTYKDEAIAMGKAFDFDRKNLCCEIIDCLKEQIAMRGETDYVAENKLLPHFENLLAEIDA